MRRRTLPRKVLQTSFRVQTCYTCRCRHKQRRARHVVSGHPAKPRVTDIDHTVNQHLREGGTILSIAFLDGYLSRVRNWVWSLTHFA